MSPKKSKEEIYTSTHVKISKYNISVHSNINHEIFDKRYANSSTNVYSSHTLLEFFGDIIYPDELNDCNARIFVYGREPYDCTMLSTLDDFHVRDDENIPKYTKRRGEYFPVYDPPNSIGYIEKRHGQKQWDGAVWVQPQMASDMLALLSTPNDFFLGIEEVRANRNKRIRGISLQTYDPNEG